MRALVIEDERRLAENIARGSDLSKLDICNLPKGALLALRTGFDLVPRHNQGPVLPTPVPKGRLKMTQDEVLGASNP